MQSPPNGSAPQGGATDCEETIVIRTEVSFYAYLINANKWVEICKPEPYRADGEEEEFENMRFIGYSENNMIFTPKNKNREQSSHIRAVCVLPENERRGWSSWTVTSFSPHLCLNLTLDSVRLSDTCSHHIFVSGNSVFGIYPEVCCGDSVRLRGTRTCHRPEIGTFKVERMDWPVDDPDDEECPQWNTIGGLDLPAFFRHSDLRSYHNPDGGFLKVVFFTAETPSCTYILACDVLPHHGEFCLAYDTSFSDVEYAVFEMKQGAGNDAFCFQLITTGILEGRENDAAWQFTDPNLSLVAKEGYLMLYNMAEWKFDSWKIELDTVDPDLIVDPNSLAISDGDENCAVVRVCGDGRDRYIGDDELPDRQRRPIQTLASNFNGQFYCLENSGPYVTRMTRLGDFENPVSREDQEASPHYYAGHFYAERKCDLPPPPVDQVIKEVAIAPVPNGLIKHLRTRPKVQFQNTFASSSVGPYHHTSYQVIDALKDYETSVEMSDQQSMAGSNV